MRVWRARLGRSDMGRGEGRSVRIDWGRLGPCELACMRACVGMWCADSVADGACGQACRNLTTADTPGAVKFDFNPDVRARDAPPRLLAPNPLSLAPA